MLVSSVNVLTLFLLHLMRITSVITIVAKPTTRRMYHHQSVHRMTRALVFCSVQLPVFTHVVHIKSINTQQHRDEWEVQQIFSTCCHLIVSWSWFVLSFWRNRNVLTNGIYWIRSSSSCSVFSHLMTEEWRQTFPLCHHASLYMLMSCSSSSCELNGILRSSQWPSSQTVMSSVQCCFQSHLNS